MYLGNHVIREYLYLLLSLPVLTVPGVQVKCYRYVTCLCPLSFQATARVTLAPPAYRSSPIRGTRQLIVHLQALLASLSPVMRARAPQRLLLLALEPVAPCQ